MSITPFTFLVNATIVREAARRAELLDLPRRRSPKFDLARRERLAEVRSAEDLELDSILDEMESGMEADVDFLLSRLEQDEDGDVDSAEDPFSEDRDEDLFAEAGAALDAEPEDLCETPVVPALTGAHPEIASANA